MNDRDESLDRHLRAAYRVEPPDTLKERLLMIPDEEQRHPSIWPAWLAAFEWRFAVTALATFAVLAVLWTAGLRTPSVDSQPVVDEATRITQEQAVRDFIIAMEYLHRSTARASDAVQGEIGIGLMLAFERGEQSFKDNSNRITNGG